MKTHIVKQPKHQIISVLIFEVQGIGWDLSMMRISYKLTKRTTENENLKNP